MAIGIMNDRDSITLQTYSESVDKKSTVFHICRIILHKVFQNI